MKLFRRLKGFRTYLAVVCLTGLAAVQIGSGHILMGLQTLFSAMAAAGLRSAISGDRS